MSKLKKLINKTKEYILSRNAQITLGVLVVVIGIFALSYNYILLKRDRVFDLMNIAMYESETPMDITGAQTGDIENDTITNNDNPSNDSKSGSNNTNNNDNKNKSSNNNKSNRSSTSNKSSTSNRYSYIGYLEIPKINLKKGFLDVNSKYNSIDYNVTVIKTSTFPDKPKGNFILAAHSGTATISYFRNLYQLKKGDIARVYYKKKKYTYKIVKIYNQAKTGKLSIYRDYNKTTLTLITCTKDNKKKQTLYILELTKTENY